MTSSAASVEPLSADEGSTLSSYYKKSSHEDEPALPTRRRRSRLCCWRRFARKQLPRGPRLQCRDCDQLYYERDNRRGKCPMRRGTSDRVVDVCTCAPIINSCMRKHSDEYNHSPRSNSTTSSRRGKRRALLTLLAVLLPCIWCYYPCHSCLGRGKENGCWGARHTPAIPKSESEISASL